MAKMDTTAAITIEQLTRRFGATVAVNALSLEVRRGEILGCLGHNGAGKMTMIRLLHGILTPHGGQMRVLGLDPVNEGAILCRHTGVLTETPRLPLFPDCDLPVQHHSHFVTQM
jgi:ABC-2 type transport system ATP-binding protein